MHEIFWTCFAGTVYAYFGHPFLLLTLGRLTGSCPGGLKQHFSPRKVPRVTFLIPVQNEEHVIHAKLENAFALDYPRPDDVIIASDGSTDLTAGLAKAFASDRTLRFADLPER